MAVKERAPGTPTLYAGYTNGMLGVPADRRRVPAPRLRGRLRLQVGRPAGRSSIRASSRSWSRRACGSPSASSRRRRRGPRRGRGPRAARCRSSPSGSCSIRRAWLRAPRSARERAMADERHVANGPIALRSARWFAGHDVAGLAPPRRRSAPPASRPTVSATARSSASATRGRTSSAATSTSARSRRPSAAASPRPAASRSSSRRSRSART